GSAVWRATAPATPRRSRLTGGPRPRPDQLTFYLCWAPPGRPATMTYFITIAGRRWPVEETFKTGKDVLGWDQCQARTWNGICRHTALSALAQLRAAAIRNTIDGSIDLPAPGPGDDYGRGPTADADITAPDPPITPANP